LILKIAEFDEDIKNVEAAGIPPSCRKFAKVSIFDKFGENIFVKL